MTEDDLLLILRSIRQECHVSELDTDIRNTSLDSLDLIELRSTLEARMGKALPDDTWFSCKTLRELLRSLP